MMIVANKETDNIMAKFNWKAQDIKAEERCSEWQRLARNYNEVNENGRDSGLDSSKPAETLRGTT